MPPAAEQNNQPPEAPQAAQPPQDASAPPYAAAPPQPNQGAHAGDLVLGAPQNSAPQSEQVSPLAIIALVVTLLIGPLGLILGIIAYKQRKGKADKVLSIISIVLGGLSVLLLLLSVLFFIVAFTANP